jgi:hypothetical protein
LPVCCLTSCRDSVWTRKENCEAAFQLLKTIFGKDIVLVKINYGPEAGKIKLAVDSSFHSAGAVHVRRSKWFGTALCLSDVESRYSQPKLEICGVYRLLKKLQTMLWGQHFELQVDAHSLIQMINSPSLSNAPMTHWVAFIQLLTWKIFHHARRSFSVATWQ